MPDGPVMRETSWLAGLPAVGAPSTLTITLPGVMPAPAAGEPGKTRVTVSRPALTSTATPIPVYEPLNSWLNCLACRGEK